MAKTNYSNFDYNSIISALMLLLYLSLGFIPNWEAVDKIAPQWLVMSILNLVSLLYFIYNRKKISLALTLNLKGKLSLTYLLFIIWAMCSFIYAINQTEVIVNLSRQLNVFLMFFSTVLFLYFLKKKLRFIPWLITIILGIEIYSVLNEAINMINSYGSIDSGALKGVTANRNITAFSLAIKIPFILFLINEVKKGWLKIFLSGIIFLVLIGLSMIQSRASFIALGLTIIAYIFLHTFIYFKFNKKLIQLFQIGYLVIPVIISIIVNQTFLSNKGADAVSRAATISISTNDGSVNQRLRYYEDVLTHMSSNPIFGVGLGNWKLKSIEYDSRDIIGYVVPYHAHSDFIQLGAELGIIGFLLYLGIFIWAVYYVFILIRYSDLDINEKVFLFLLLTSLGVYFVDANLNFPIARPQLLVIWALIMALINLYYLKYQNKRLKIIPNKKLNFSFLVLSILLVVPSIYVTNKVYKSLKGQMFLLQDFNSNQFNIPLSQVDNFVPDIPNITVTTIPINSVKARYYVNAKKYDKALKLIEKGTKANPYLYYSEILKSQIFQEKGQLDSAKFYARKAFFGLPNNGLHTSRYINLINITRDIEALEESFELLTEKNDINNWKNYLIVASGLYPLKDKLLTDKAKRATELFPDNQEFKQLYSAIAIGPEGINQSASFSAKGLEFYNSKNYKKAAEFYEKAIEANPLDYTHFENAATANYMIGNLEKALDQINAVMNDLNPLNGKCEFIKALIFIRMGDPIGACPLLATSRDSGFAQAEATFNQYCR
jgi:O-antigen ligase/tetratricopeptide (TPR) repeat protein